MAQSVAKGAQSAGAQATLIEADSFGPEQVASYDAFAFGCPAMGAEVLEEEIFDPMFQSVLPKLEGAKAALFGSYGWGDGEWMQNWEQSCRDGGVELIHDSVICCEAPEADTLSACEALGAALAQ